MGRHANKTKAPFSVYDIAPDATYREAARSSLRQQFDALMHNLPGTRAGDDSEALHDMRVASRRLRAALTVFGDAFPVKEFRAMERRIGQITDALGAVRDADVQREYLAEAAQSAPESERVGLHALLEQMRVLRDKDRVTLVRELDRLERSGFAAEFARFLEELDG